MEGNLRIQKIWIHQLGSIEDLTLRFNKRIALVEGTAWKEILLAFRVICGCLLSEEEKALFLQESRVEADLQLDRRQCTVLYKMDRLSGGIVWEVKISMKDGFDYKYIERNVRQYLKDIPEKRGLRVLYDPEKQQIMERFLMYEAEDDGQKECLFERTAGLSGTSVFRRLLRDAAYLDPSEDKVMNDERHPGMEMFFKLNRFWNRIDLERGIEKGLGPLVLKERKEEIEKEGMKIYLQKMRKQYGGQLIIVTAK